MLNGLKVCRERGVEVNILTSAKLNTEEMAIQFSTNCLGNDSVFHFNFQFR